MESPAETNVGKKKQKKVFLATFLGKRAKSHQCETSLHSLSSSRSLVISAHVVLTLNKIAPVLTFKGFAPH